LHEEVILYTGQGMLIPDRFRIYVIFSITFLLLYGKNLYTLHIDPLSKPSREDVAPSFCAASSETALKV